MSDNGERDATVKTLTAEVRTLMVGSRQVTMSVYNQLDCVPHSQIEPFGRVNPKDADRADIWVVGRHKSDGSLVRARSPWLSEELDRQSFVRAAWKISADVLEAIPSAADDALESFVNEAVCAFARLVHVGFFDSLRSGERLRESVRAAGSRQTGRLQVDIAKRVKELEAGSTEGTGGPFDSRAFVLVRAYGQADAEAQAVAGRVKAAWSELPLIVLAGLR